MRNVLNFRCGQNFCWWPPRWSLQGTILTFCSVNKMNMVGFARNYFASTNCSCEFVGKNDVCKHCLFLVESLNYFVVKFVWMKSYYQKILKLGKKTCTRQGKLKSNQLSIFLKMKTELKWVLILLRGVIFFRKRNYLNILKKRLECKILSYICPLLSVFCWHYFLDNKFGF